MNEPVTSPPLRGAPSTSEASLDEVLEQRFGLEAFHPWQREAISGVLGAPGRVLVVAPTGGGKSLTYQLPATVLEGTALVLSPLVALMEDQVRSLTARGIRATFLASTLDPDVRREREALFARGHYKLVFAAPERLASDAFVGLLSRARISMVAVDEAHCISQWGHDFRPDYLRIGALLERLRPERVLACTATATPEVRREILEQLGMTGAPYKEVLRGFARPNLHLEARPVEGPKMAKAALFETLAKALGSANCPRGAAIVYAATRRASEQWAASLREKGWNASHYHAGMAAEERTRVANAFAARSLDVVVATNAFGMGIDRPDIRAVVHVQPPASIEAYYQEVGRAGRDGDEAHGLLLCSGADIGLRRRLSSSDESTSGVEAAARAWRHFRELLQYLDARSCRHDFILRYFGDEREVLGGCGHCDICEALDGGPEERQEDASTVVRMALSGVARAKQRAGLVAIAEMLSGVDSERTRRFGFTHLSTFGLLGKESQDWVVALLRSLLAAGWIDLTPTEHPVPLLTRAGWQVLRSADAVRLVLPSREIRKARASNDAPRAKRAPIAMDEATRPLFERLRAHRAEVARDRRVPAYVVAHDRTLVELAMEKPRSTGELADVYGFGPSRIEQYGEGFLRVIRDDG